MRVLLVIGILLIAFGGYVLAGGFSYQADKKSVDLGVLKASISETRLVPKWVGGLLIVGGLGLELLRRATQVKDVRHRAVV